MILTSPAAQIIFSFFIVIDWTAIEKGVKIPWDLEGTSLQIKTDSNQETLVSFHDKDSAQITYLSLKFFSKTKFGLTGWTLKIPPCISALVNLPAQPPVEVEKTWTITKTATALIMTCNNLEVLNYLFADSSNSDCVPKWGGDVVELIKFTTDDEASDLYITGKFITY